MVQWATPKKLSKTPKKPSKKVDRYHTGKWGINPLSGEHEVWSCCMSQDKESEV